MYKFKHVRSKLCSQERGAKLFLRSPNGQRVGTMLHRAEGPHTALVPVQSEHRILPEN